MTKFRSPHGSCPYSPDNLTIPQFLLDSQHPNKPLRKQGNPWLIEDATGRKIYFEEVRKENCSKDIHPDLSQLQARIFGLANALFLKWSISAFIVCIFGNNHVDYPVALWAIHRLGAIALTVSPKYTADELHCQLNATAATLIISHSEGVLTARNAADRAGLPVILLDTPKQPSGNLLLLDDLVAEGLTKHALFVEKRLGPGEGKTKVAILSLTSGTSGQPRAVAISHYSVITNVIQMSAFNNVNTAGDACRWRPGDVATGDTYGLIVNLHWLLFSGLSVIVVPTFDFGELLKSIKRHSATHLLLVPPQVILLCKNQNRALVRKLSHVRHILCAAAPLSPEVTQQLTKILPGVSIAQGYGMTETATAVTMTAITDESARSVGQLLPGVVARVVKEDGSLATAGQQGELVVTGPQVALRYMAEADENDPPSTCRWVHTGDLVEINNEGDVFMIDRLQDIIKDGDFRVSPSKLEGHLLIHPDVEDTCVVGVPNNHGGEIPLAFVVLKDKVLDKANSKPKNADKIKASIDKHVSDHKEQHERLNGRVVFTESIPKNPSGKILRWKLRDRAKQLREQQYTNDWV
ncbi:acetyl-CoA synthetase-like protein [Phlegmacium glaucopus]|nr:acetyl-CoA synthetase-like protein [Phlegmacium glaucopus]